eukprot:jgi/Ulvmu1/8701/UM047_0041.1
MSHGWWSPGTDSLVCGRLCEASWRGAQLSIVIRPRMHERHEASGRGAGSDACADRVRRGQAGSACRGTWHVCSSCIRSQRVGCVQPFMHVRPGTGVAVDSDQGK